MDLGYPPSGVGCNSSQYFNYTINFLGHWPANWQPVLMTATAIFYAAKSCMATYQNTQSQYEVL